PPPDTNTAQFRRQRQMCIRDSLDSSARLDTNKSSIVLLGFAAVIGCALLELSLIHISEPTRL
ncbi:hypothetical protein ACRTEE_23285, partial [Vibrio alginolyticus]|uniref:hypothetical protein n=1 Tax=Vibrio alginolyticus TaxID=663 RepID=UPI003D7D3B4F